ncbi:outer membrane beta-barrel protein [Ferruginibacter paludis]|uniref:outer membrane beta-barrel protein n=1 Tax=Ferruginibacter paludis TaxID=1310417 RepID=UPI0025B3D5BC|nr:outer membrane beta-barrel protein [Ferruginibacter paludis]MDN3659310.1 outer membrane beta-barrel protein [Ferruginibacter paludis]
MEKKLCCTAFLFLAINLFGQSPGKVKFGIKLGTAVAKSRVEYNDDNTSTFKYRAKTGLIAGGYIDIAINKTVSFQPAILYVRKGVKEIMQSSQYFYGTKMAFNYMELPLNILYASYVKTGNYFIGGGLSPAIKLSDYLYGDELKSFDLGIDVLVGYKSQMGFSINLGYTYGMLNVSDFKNYIKKIQNKYFSIALGYEF